MKVYSFLIITTFLLAVSLVVIIGCKYDVAEPQYNKPAAAHTTVTITSIEPAQEALPGVNTITIHGGDFTGAIDTSVVHNVATGRDTSVAYNGVTFNNVRAEIIEFSSTSIKVRRPNLTGDSITLNVATTQGLVEAKSDLYKIDPVIAHYGSFLDNVQLNAVAIDNAENLYVINYVSTTATIGPFNVYKVTPGAHTPMGIITQSRNGVLDAKIGPDGNLYYVGGGSAYGKPGTGGGKIVGKFNTQTRTDSAWYTSSNKNFTCFDFDVNNGYIYAGGTKTGLVVIRPNKSIRQETLYESDTIFAIRVVGSNLYVVAGSSTRAIWCHSLADTSAVSAKPQLPFFDLSTTDYAYRTPRSMSFSADGTKMYLGFYSPNPILVVDVATKNSEILYKGIIPDYCKHFCFGNKLYMISGNTSITPVVRWDLYQIDVGTSGAPNYGR
jgi:hypothetical protein